MLNRETNNNNNNKCRRSQIIGNTHNKTLLIPATVGSRRNNLLSSFIAHTQTNTDSDIGTDAIVLFGEQGNSQLASQAAHAPISSVVVTSKLLSTASSDCLSLSPLSPSAKTNLREATHRRSLQQEFAGQIATAKGIQLNKLSNHHNTKQQPVNPRAIIDKNPLGLKSRKHGFRLDTYTSRMMMIKMNHNYFLKALLLALCAISTTAQLFVTADGSLNSNLQKLKISPDIINIPSSVDVIKVELHGNTVKPGDPVPAKNFKDLNMAKIVWDVSNFDARHTLLLLDLDRKQQQSVPGPNGTNSIYNQFTSLNIPGNVINAGQTIVAFDTPVVPCQPSSKHRILMLAFHQKQNIDISDVAYMSASSGQSSKRENFKLNDFINRHRLDLVAANVFLAIGETNGVCSSSGTLHNLQGVSLSILIAMVTAIIGLRFTLTTTATSCRRSTVN